MDEWMESPEMHGDGVELAKEKFEFLTSDHKYPSEPTNSLRAFIKILFAEGFQIDWTNPLEAWQWGRREARLRGMPLY